MSEQIVNGGKRKYDGDAEPSGAVKSKKARRDSSSKVWNGEQRRRRDGTAAHNTSRRSRRQVKERRASLVDGAEGDGQRQDGTTSDAQLARTSKKREKTRKKHTEPAGQDQEVADAEVKVLQDQVDSKKALDRKAKKAAKAERKKARHEELARKDRPDDTFESKTTLSIDSNRMISPPSAGRFLNHDPIFVRGDDSEECIITANDREVQVCSLGTSLIVRSCPAPEGKKIVAYAVDVEYDLVNIALDDGSVSSWDWTTDDSFKKELTTSGTLRVMNIAKSTADKKSEAFYVAATGNRDAIFAANEKLYTTEQLLDSIQVLGDAEYIVSRGPKAVVLGARRDDKSPTSDFVFIELPLMTQSVCVDARLLPVIPPQKKAAPRRRGLSLAIGNTEGQIHLYDDVSSLFTQTGQPSLPTPRILHWHREAVGSVKFSPDGNYLISGGTETVLVIWQLSTGKRQYLPHLTAAIERIVINPEGHRYALQMGDNSIMVLSTSELKPVANFAGLQMPTRTTSFLTPSRPQAAVLHPRDANQLLLTVAPTQPRHPMSPTARPYLQAFDLATSRHLSRQALTRNNVTDFNLGPDGTPILPPDVTHIAISSDGQWMATVEEWMPCAADVAYLAPATDGGAEDVEMWRRKKKEVCLKIWYWDEGEGIWGLGTRIEAPHGRDQQSGFVAGVWGLESDPASNSFATVGEDYAVKIWGMKSVGMEYENGGVEWRCRRTVQLSNQGPTVDSGLNITYSSSNSETLTSTACLAYSADGSMLAVTKAQPHNSTLDSAPLVHFINTTKLDTPIPKSGLAKEAIVALGFLNQYFIVVSRPAVYVWDLVNDTLVYKVKLPGSSAIRLKLALNQTQGTFAVVTGAQRLEIYGKQRPECLFRQDFGVGIEAVLPARGTGMGEYVVLFADATVRTISAATGTGTSRLHLPAPEPVVEAAKEAIEVDEESDLDNASEPEPTDGQGAAVRKLEQKQQEDDRPVVRPEQLAEIFEVGDSYAMPSMREMLGKVVGLFARKAIPVAPAAFR